MSRADDPLSRIEPTRKEKPMFQRWVIAALLASPLCVLAADDKAMTPQQGKMATCNKEAGDKALKGDERKKFMSDCLKAAKMTQQEKMKACKKEAGEKALKGDERKKFMSDCLKGPANS
jgi:psiF repeat-containing protein